MNITFTVLGHEPAGQNIEVEYRLADDPEAPAVRAWRPLPLVDGAVPQGDELRRQILAGAPTAFFQRLVQLRGAQVDADALVGLHGDSASVPPPTPRPASPAQIEAQLKRSIQQRLDGFAQEREYDGIVSLCSYATDPNPKFAAEGQRGVALRSATWAKSDQIRAQVLAGERPMPSAYADIEAELPALTWPPAPEPIPEPAAE